MPVQSPKESAIPINKYTAKGDKEEIPSNPQPANSFPFHGGVGTNHVTSEASVEKRHDQQWDHDDSSGESEDTLPLKPGFPGHEDPNMSGARATKPVHDWQAGPLSEWDQNDDYKRFVWDVENIVETQLYKVEPYEKESPEDEDEDFDSTGVITPWRVDASQGERLDFTDSVSPHDNFQTPTSIRGYEMSPIVRR